VRPACGRRARLPIHGSWDGRIRTHRASSIAIRKALISKIPRLGPSPALWLSRGVAVGVSLAAFLVLAAWVLVKSPHSTAVMPSDVVMNADTALGLGVAALALWLLSGPATSSWRQRFALGCSLAVAALGAATLAEYLLGLHLGIDQLLGSAKSYEINTTHPGRMAPETALIFALMGAALFWMSRRRRVLAAQGLTMLVAMLGLFNLTGYVYGVVAFYKLDHESSIGLATAAAFVALAGGMLCAQPNAGLMRSITSDLPGGVVIRRLLLAVLVLPLALGWLELACEHAGVFDHTHGTGLAGLVGSAALIVLIWRTARVLDRDVEGRKREERELQRSNELLRERVRERTAELVSANQSIDRGNTELSRMEAMLLLQSSALEAAANAIVITSCQGSIEWVNPAYCALTGYSAEEARGKNPQALTKSGKHDEAFYENVWTTILAGNVWRNEMISKRKNGSLYTEFQTITPVRDKGGTVSHFISVKEDITDKKSLEEQALRAQRVQNLGLLAAGIGHDFNNALAPVLLATPLLRPLVAPRDGQRMLDMIEQSAERCAALVHQMLSFARGSSEKKVNLRVTGILQEVVTIAQMTFPKSITIESHLSRNLGLIHGDPTQITQIFMNLFINARDAMTQGGRLVITASNCLLGADEAAEIAGGRPGEFLRIEVRDSGTGIAPELLEKIWEPFFTTKGEGKGTGLGLSTVRGIVQQHLGFMEIQTTCGAISGNGTAFTVYLPAVPAEDTLFKDAGVRPSPARRGEGELVLVVDDEETVLEVIETILIGHGYRVLTAGDGVQAISTLESHSAEVRLLITDGDMPVLGGTALVAELRRQRPNLPVIMMSGTGSRSANPHGLVGIANLPKPFTADALLVVVHGSLDRDLVAS
jgi:two-component system cell cycle sensor histidine kinase/response regulator CckA